MAKKQKSAPSGEDTLVKTLRGWVARLPAAAPLSSTRALGAKHGVANTTIFRALAELVAEGVLWQHPVNGRFYPIAARASLDRPKPVACLFRRLELGSVLYRELLEGVSAGCGKERRTMLLWHDELLVNHPDLVTPPRFAPPDEQRAILKGFLDHHGEFSGGYILDHIWDDEAIRLASRKLRPAVLLYRRAPADLDIGNVYADFAGAATQTIAHLLGKGFDKIVPVRPFAGDPAVDVFITELEKAAEGLDCRNKLTSRLPADVSAIARHAGKKCRLALVVPEDHVAVQLCMNLRARGYSVPADVGVFSVMGTSVGADAGISRLSFDFRAMGALAVSLLKQDFRQSLALPGTLETGNST